MTDALPTPVFHKGDRVRVGISLNLQAAGLSGRIGNVEKVVDAGGYDVRLDHGQIVWIDNCDLERELIL